MIFKKFLSFLYEPKGSMRFQLDDWYRTPETFHSAVVKHLTKEGKTVQTIAVHSKWTSIEVSTLIVDGKKYRLKVINSSSKFEVGGIQTAVLNPLD